MENRPGPFDPENVDRQIDRYRTQNKHSPDSQLIHDLYEVSERDARVLARARERLGQQMQLNEPTNINQIQSFRQRTDALRRRTNPAWRAFSVLAAVVVLSLLVGSLLYVLNLQQHKTLGPTTATPVNSLTPTPGTPPPPAPEYLYLTELHGIYKYDQRTKKVLWYYPTATLNAATGQFVNEMGHGSVKVVDGQAYFLRNATENEKIIMYIVAINAKDGQKAWERKLDTMPENTDQIQVDGDTVYVVGTNSSTDNGTLYALNTSDGTLRWSQRTEERVRLGSAHKGAVYITKGRMLFALGKDGKELWHTDELPSPRYYEGIPLFTDNVIYVGATEVFNATLYYYYAYNANTGQLLWKTNDGQIRASITQVTFANNVLYSSASSDKRLYALNAKNGKTLWSQDTDYIPVAPQIVGDTIYLAEGSTDPTVPRSVVARNISDGSVRWSTEIKEEGMTIDGFIGSISIYDGKLYYGTGDEHTHPSVIQVLAMADGKLLDQFQYTEHSASIPDVTLAP
jgi:outer membrane protein assembly factor BamB